MNVQFVCTGSPSDQILTTFHPPVGRQQRTGVVLAPPIGTEYLRTHWVFRRLAAQLTRAGFSVMRMDYRGTGDSSGEISEIYSMRTWCEDLHFAADSLRECSDCQQISIVGLRLGAAIAIQAAPGIDDLQQIIAWDPILDGDAYLDSLRQMQLQILDLWSEPVEAVRTGSHEEILGSLYSRQLLEDIEQIKLDEQMLESLRCQIVTTDLISDASDTEAARWNDLRYLELAWLPNRCLKAITAHLVNSATD